MKSPLIVRLRSILRRFYPLPEAFLGYLFGILFAAVMMVGKAILHYTPLPLPSALTDALAAELPFWFAAALLPFVRPQESVGKCLVFLKAACCGYGAERLLPSGYPSVGYFRYVCISMLMTALYSCSIRHTVLRFDDHRTADRTLLRQRTVDCLTRWLFYAGSALLLLPLKYFIGS